jgi:hypothetical protein
MMNYRCRRAINYPTDEDTYLSIDAKKVLEKVEPNQKKGRTIYVIFNRVWYDVMSQELKYLNEGNYFQLHLSRNFEHAKK